MTKYNYTNFIYELHELVKTAVPNSCSARFVVRVIK
jgi:hypothetical protein